MRLKKVNAGLGVITALFLSTSISVYAQTATFKIHPIKLPSEVAYFDNQFSAIQVYNNKLFLLSECRLQDKAEAKIYVASLSALKKNLRDTSRVLAFEKYAIHNLEQLRSKMLANGDDYEGIEAAIFENGIVYLSIETATPSPNCYLIKGTLGQNSLVMDTSFLIAIPKYTGADGKAIYNAGYEAMVKNGDNIFAFYEYNYFSQTNYVKVLDRFSFIGNQCQHDFPMDKLPFRITDITATGNNHYTAINFFFKGDGPDAVYRPALNDSANNSLVQSGGQYGNYCRLIDVEIKDSKINWRPLWEFPVEYMGHNWECIAAYKKGVFIVNDKFTTKKPYRSELLFIEWK